MATVASTAQMDADRADVENAIDEYGNTITITPVTVSEEPNDEGIFEKTTGTSYNISGVNYDTESLARDFGNSIILNEGESMMLIKHDVSLGDNDIVTIDGIEYSINNIGPLKSADVLLAQMLRLGIKQD